MFYHRKLPKLTFSPNIFDPLIEYGLENPSQWQKGYDQNDSLWNIEELKISTAEFPILNEIYNGLQAEFKRPSFFLSKVLPGGLVNHVDHRKWGNMAIPLSGNFETSPIQFLDPFNHVVEEFHFSKLENNQFIPVIFNTRMTHAVRVSPNCVTPRIVLMMDLFDWPDSLFEKIDNDNIWENTQAFHYLS